MSFWTFDRQAAERERAENIAKDAHQVGEQARRNVHSSVAGLGAMQTSAIFGNIDNHADTAARAAETEHARASHLEADKASAKYGHAKNNFENVMASNTVTPIMAMRAHAEMMMTREEAYPGSVSPELLRVGMYMLKSGNFREYAEHCGQAIAQERQQAAALAAQQVTAFAQPHEISNPPDQKAVQQRGPEYIRDLKRQPDGAYNDATGKTVLQDRGQKVTVVPGAKAEHILAAVELMQSKGSKTISVRGSEEFRREAWLQASARGMSVRGYEPTKLDLATLERRQAITERINRPVEHTEQREQHSTGVGRDQQREAMQSVRAMNRQAAQEPVQQSQQQERSKGQGYGY